MEKLKETKKAVTAAKKAQNKKSTTRNEAKRKRVKEKKQKRLQRAKMTKEQKEGKREKTLAIRKEDAQQHFGSSGKCTGGKQATTQ